MNRGMIIWNAALTLLCGYLLFNSFSNTGTGLASGTQRSTGVSGAFRMGYFEMDSIAANFDMVKELKAEMTKREDAINAELDGLTKTLQQKLSYYQQQASSGALTQDQGDAASREMRTLEDNLKSRKQSLESEYSDFVLRRQNEIKSRIEDFLKEYNKSSQFSYIVSYEPGLFYYKDSAFNITQDVIQGLNSQYKTLKK